MKEERKRKLYQLLYLIGIHVSHERDDSTNTSHFAATVTVTIPKVFTLRKENLAFVEKQPWNVVTGLDP